MRHNHRWHQQNDLRRNKSASIPGYSQYLSNYGGLPFCCWFLLCCGLCIPCCCFCCDNHAHSDDNHNELQSEQDMQDNHPLIIESKNKIYTQSIPHTQPISTAYLSYQSMGSTQCINNNTQNDQ